MSWRRGAAALGGALIACALGACVPQNQLGMELPPLWFGTYVVNATVPPAAAGNGTGRGIRVVHVAYNSPAETAGVHDGDVILTVDGKPTASVGDLIDVLKVIPAPRKVPVVLVRDGGQRTLEVRLVQRPGAGPAPTTWLGTSFVAVAFPPTAMSDGVPGGNRIDLIAPGSPAALAGLEEGDVIVRFDGKATAETDELSRAINAVAEPRAVPVVLIRNGEKRTLSVAMAKRPADMNDIFKKAFIDRIAAEQKTAAEAKRKGDSASAFGHYVIAVRLLMNQNRNYSANIDAILKFDIGEFAEIVPKLRPRPAVPPDAERHTNRALAILKDAVGDRDNDRAVDVFWQAIYEAPWIADLYRDRGLVQARAGFPEAAAADMRRYLALNPAAPDTREIDRKLDALDRLAGARRPWYPYLRAWNMQAGDVESVTLRNLSLSVTVLRPAAQGVTREGDVLCRGTVSGRQFTGTCTNYLDQPNAQRCFGRTITAAAQGGIDDKGTLALRYLGDIHYNTEACVIDSQAWIVYRSFPGPAS